jgi:hypothetical protein
MRDSLKCFFLKRSNLCRTQLPLQKGKPPCNKLLQHQTAFSFSSHSFFSFFIMVYLDHLALWLGLLLSTTSAAVVPADSSDWDFPGPDRVSIAELDGGGATVVPISRASSMSFVDGLPFQGLPTDSDDFPSEPVVTSLDFGNSPTDNPFGRPTGVGADIFSDPATKTTTQRAPIRTVETIDDLTGPTMNPISSKSSGSSARSTNTPTESPTSTPASDKNDMKTFFWNGTMPANKNAEPVDDISMFLGDNLVKEWVHPKGVAEGVGMDATDPHYWLKTLEDLYGLLIEKGCTNQSFGQELTDFTTDVSHVDTKHSVWKIGLASWVEAYIQIPKFHDKFTDKMVTDCKSLFREGVNFSKARMSRIKTDEDDVFFELGVRFPDGDSYKRLPITNVLSKSQLIGRADSIGWQRRTHEVEYKVEALFINANPPDKHFEADGQTLSATDSILAMCLDKKHTGKASNRDCWARNHQIRYALDSGLQTGGSRRVHNSTGQIFSALYVFLPEVSDACTDTVFNCLVERVYSDKMDNHNQVNWWKGDTVKNDTRTDEYKHLWDELTAELREPLGLPKY